MIYYLVIATIVFVLSLLIDNAVFFTIAYTLFLITTAISVFCFLNKNLFENEQEKQKEKNSAYKVKTMVAAIPTFVVVLFFITLQIIIMCKS